MLDVSNFSFRGYSKSNLLTTFSKGSDPLIGKLMFIMNRQMLDSSRTKIFRCNKRIKLESEMYCFCQFNGCKTVSNDMPICNIYQTTPMNSCQDSVNSICSNYHKCIKDQFVKYSTSRFHNI